MIEEKILDSIQKVIDQKLHAARFRDNELWLVFDSDMLIIGFPDISCRCINCKEKEGVKVI